MCYKAPGPRCSAWAKTKLDEANGVSLNYGDEDVYKAQKEAIVKAELDFDATPAGHKYLKMRIAQKMDSTGEYAERLKNGIALRKMQLAAIKSTDEGDNFNHGKEAPFHTTVPHHEDMATPRQGWLYGKVAPELEEYDKAADNAMRVLNPDEKTAVYWATSDGSSYLNSKLAKKGTPDAGDDKWTWEKQKNSYVRDDYKPTFVKEKVRALNSAFRNHRLSEPAHLYRGINDCSLPDQILHYSHSDEESKANALAYLQERYPVGEEVKINEYMSTTADPGTANRFVNYRTPIILEIQTKAAIPVGKMSAWKNAEREYLVNKGGKYKVEGIYEDVPYIVPITGPESWETDNVTVVRLIEIEPEAKDPSKTASE